MPLNQHRLQTGRVKHTCVIVYGAEGRVVRLCLKQLCLDPVHVQGAGARSLAAPHLPAGVVTGGLLRLCAAMPSAQCLQMQGD